MMPFPCQRNIRKKWIKNGAKNLSQTSTHAFYKNKQSTKVFEPIECLQKNKCSKNL